MTIYNVDFLTYLVPVYQYYNSDNVDHFYTKDVNEADNFKRKKRRTGKYSFEGIKFELAANPQPQSVPLYRYYKQRTVDHFLTTDPAETNGYKFEVTLGYCYTVMLYLYASALTSHIFYLSNKMIDSNAWNRTIV